MALNPFFTVGSQKSHLTQCVLLQAAGLILPRNDLILELFVRLI